MATSKTNEAPDASKGRYHHGALRYALIDAAKQLISDKGSDGFTMADACRLAGVSTAAPYRHFADRDDLIDAVCHQGFEQLGERVEAARDRHAAGSIESIVAIGQTYVHFGVEDPAMFHVMWGRYANDPDLAEANFRKHADPEATQPGQRCFEILLEAIDAYRRVERLDDLPTIDIALPLWTIVHGTASLMLAKKFRFVAPDTDTDKLVDRTARAFLNGLSRKGG